MFEVFVLDSFSVVSLEEFEERINPESTGMLLSLSSKPLK